MLDYTVAFDRNVAINMTEAEMDLMKRVTLMHKKANPHVSYVVWDERDGATAIYFDETEKILVTTREKGNEYVTDIDKYNRRIVVDPVYHI